MLRLKEEKVMEVRDVQIKKSLGAWKPNYRLTNLCLAYYESPTFAHKRIFPSCPVALPSGHYYEFSKGDLARDNVQQKPPYGVVKPAIFGISEKSYSCKVYQVNIGLDKLMVLPYQRENAPGSADPYRARTKTVAEQIALHQEKVFAEKFFKTGVWTNTWTGAATTDTANKQFKKLDNSDVDPVAFFDARAIEIRRNGRRKPNKLALGIETFEVLKNHPYILERIKYSGTTQNPAVVTEQVLAQVFGVDAVVVLDATYNDAQHGAADNMKFICDSKGALLLYAPDTPQIDEPSAGYLFQWQLDGGNYIAVDVHDGAPGTHTEIIEGVVAYDMCKTSDDLGIYFADCVG